MDITTVILIFLVGLIAGGYGTIVGAGGGFIFVPVLILLFHINPAMAAGTGIVIVFINSLSGVFGYAKQKRIHYRIGLILAIGALPGSLLGVGLLRIYSSSYFFVVFATLLVVLGIFLFASNSPITLQKKESTPEISREGAQAVESSGGEIAAALSPSEHSQIRIIYLVPLGLLMGILSSYLGIGGGWMLVPILIYFFKRPTHLATATSIFSLTLYSSLGVISQIFYGNIDWQAILWGGIGVILGSQMGVWISQKIPSKVVIQLLSILLIVIGFRMYFN